MISQFYRKKVMPRGISLMPQGIPKTTDIKIIFFKKSAARWQDVTVYSRAALSLSQFKKGYSRNSAESSKF